MNECKISVPVQCDSQGLTQSCSPPEWHSAFLKMLPRIVDHAGFAFRHYREESRNELIQETVANSCVAYARLVEQGRTEVATWRSLARYAVSQVRDGRRVGTSMNAHDICQRRCQIAQGIQVQSMSKWDGEEEDWDDLLLEDRHATPAEMAILRVDFREFLRTLSRQKRKLALQLARGHATKWIASKFQISAGRVSQYRRELYEAWKIFQGEPISA